MAAWFYGMFCISQVMSPLLPAILVVGQSVAAGTLRSKNIYCVDLPRILMAGKVQIFCFDKTGNRRKVLNSTARSPLLNLRVAMQPLQAMSRNFPIWIVLLGRLRLFKPHCST